MFSPLSSSLFCMSCPLPSSSFPRFLSFSTGIMRILVTQLLVQRATYLNNLPDKDGRLLEHHNCGLSVWAEHNHFLSHRLPCCVCFLNSETGGVCPSHSATLKASSFCRIYCVTVPETDKNALSQNAIPQDTFPWRLFAFLIISDLGVSV